MKVSVRLSHICQVTNPLPKKVPLSISVNESDPLLIACDDLKLFRMCMNVLSAACKRTAEGSISLRLSLSGLTELLVECELTGPEISAADVAAILLKPESEGVGDASLTGFKVAAVLAKSLGGTYGIRDDDSSEGSNPAESGTTIWFLIPVRTSPGSKATRPVAATVSTSCMAACNAVAACEPKVSPSPDSSSNKAESSTGTASTTPVSPSSSKESRVQHKVLVVDDSLVVRKSVSRALSMLGYDVEVATNGLEGLKKLQKTVYAFVLLDYLMPVMDGFDCVQQYRSWEKERRPQRSQYIVGISSHASDKDSERGLLAGMDIHYQKPITVKILKSIHESEEVLARKVEEQASPEKRGSGVSPSVTSRGSLSQLQRVSDRSVVTSSQHSVSGTSSVFDERETLMYCLVVTIQDTESINGAVQDIMMRSDWMCEIVHSCADTTAMLQSRIWDAVLFDYCIDRGAGVACIEEFRQWEKDNRITRQNNVFLLCPVLKPCYQKLTGTTSPVILTGFDGAMSLPAKYDEFQRQISLNMTGLHGSLKIITR